MNGNRVLAIGRSLSC